jgi:hypothetical protein
VAGKIDERSERERGDLSDHVETVQVLRKARTGVIARSRVARFSPMLGSEISPASAGTHEQVRSGRAYLPNGDCHVNTAIT